MAARLSTAAILVLLSPAAFAADAVVDVPADPIPVASGFQGGFDISVYGGASASPHSGIDYDFNDGLGARSANPSWDGASFEMPPYYGVRGTYWFDSAPNWGLALDFTHAKVEADLAEAPDFTQLEFTDGINLLTANAFYRHEFTDRITPYAGVGVGLSIPHVEAFAANGSTQTAEYQVTGVAASALVGVDFAITERISVFGEYKFSYAQVDADLNGGGYLETDLIINQAAVGLTFKLF